MNTVATRPVLRCCLALATTVVLAACTSAGATKTGATGSPTSAKGVTLTFAAGERQSYDTDFVSAVQRLSGGAVTVKLVPYDDRATTVDKAITDDLVAGKLDVADVASRIWATHDVDAFQAYQDPFLITSREILDAAVQPAVADDALAALAPTGVTGLAVVPRSLRHVFSTKSMAAPTDFRDGKIRLNVDPFATTVFLNLGLSVDSTTASGPPTVAALRSGALTAVESDPVSARSNGYVSVAPYVMSVPISAKTTTFAANTKRLQSLDPQVASWVRQAAQQASASASAALNDKAAWASLCGAGAKVVPVSPNQLDALREAELAAYSLVSADPLASKTANRIGLLAATLPRTDSWTSCAGTASTRSSTRALDGRYHASVTQAQVAAAGDCAACGNDGEFTWVLRDGRYAMLHPVPADADLNEPSVAFVKAWPPEVPNEVGSFVIHGDQVAFRPDTNIQFGSSPTTFSFALLRNKLVWRPVSGGPDEYFSTWQKVG